MEAHFVYGHPTNSAVIVNKQRNYTLLLSFINKARLVRPFSIIRWSWLVNKAKTHKAGQNVSCVTISKSGRNHGHRLSYVWSKLNKIQG